MKENYENLNDSFVFTEAKNDYEIKVEQAQDFLQVDNRQLYSQEKDSLVFANKPVFDEKSLTEGRLPAAFDRVLSKIISDKRWASGFKSVRTAAKRLVKAKDDTTTALALGELVLLVLVDSLLAHSQLVLDLLALVLVVELAFDSSFDPMKHY